MAAANILTTGVSTADSSDVTVAAGEELTVSLKGADGRLNHSATVTVSLKDDGGAYWPVDKLTANRPALVLSAGTWRFSRGSGVSCGVFSA